MSPVRALAILLLVCLAGAASGCRVKDSAGSVQNGKKLFVAKCASCHTLRRANAKGNQGPNLDYAFAQDRRDGYPSDTIRGLVHQQILYPRRGGIMPANLVDDPGAYDIASYVAQVAAKPGDDQGQLAKIGQVAQKTTAKAVNGKLTIPTDPSGQLAYTVANATAPAGTLTIDSPNKSSVPHNISIEGPGASKQGPIIKNGATSTISVTLKPGKYTFYCSVPGHRQAGMVGAITVK